MNRTRRGKPGTVKQLTAVLWQAIGKLEHHLADVADAETVDTAELCRLTHAMSQAAGVYLKALEVGDFESRLEALEAAQAAEQGKPLGWAA
jgi:hypothetical protein